MKALLIIVSLVTITIFPSFVFAQNKVGKIQGIIKSAEGQPLQGSTVTLLKAKDSSLVKFALSAKTGLYEFEQIAFGNYLVRVTAVNFMPVFSGVINVSETNSTVNVSEIKLETEEKNLGTVVVTATRPLIENKIDKTVVNVEAAVTNAGSTALEVLEKSPGINVDRDGNISLKGKQGVIILMDGKPTYLGGQDLANLLRNMPSNQLDQIEIMSQPSARFDASGNSGVINIKTKKNQQNGFNGSISVGYTQGVYPKSTNSFIINSRKGKVNLFANYSYSYFSGFNELNLERNFRNKSTGELTNVFEQNSFIKFSGQPHNLKAGLDFFANKKTTLGIVVGGMYNNRRSQVKSESDILNGARQLTSTNLADTRNIDPWTNYSINLNLRHLLDTKGKEITADVDYVHYDTRSQQQSDNYTYDPNGGLLGVPYLLRGDLPSNINIYTARADYVHPLKNNASFEAGFKTSIVTTDNDARFLYLDGSTWKRDRRSNHFIYDENINAAYINTRKQIKKWGLQVGLRVENTNSKGRQLTTNENFDRKYTQLFPTAYVSYAANKENTLGLSYGKRIERPNYQDMNPFQMFLDQFTYMQGNPYLTPQFSHNVELSHNYKGQLNSSLNYTRTTDIISEWFEQNDTTKVTIRTKRNIATRRNIGLSLSYNKTVTKIWTVNFFANIFNNHFQGVINNVPLTADFTSFMLNTSNQFKFNKGWNAEISAFFRGANLESGIITARPQGMFSVGVGKQVLNNKGTIRLNIRDPFWLMKFRGDVAFDNIDFKIRSRWDNRQVAVSFTYRFGKNQNNVPQPRRKTSASQEEQNRVGANSQ